MPNILTSKEKYNLKIEIILSQIYDIRHRFSISHADILNDIAERLNLEKRSLSIHQSALSQYLNEGDGVYRP